MVQATENQINALIKAIKELPVNCKDFETADVWVGIIMELEKIRENKAEEPETNPTEVVEDG